MKKTDCNNTIYIFNPYYRLLLDDDSPILKSRSGWLNEDQHIADTDFSVRIHPVHAILFSLFSGGQTITDVVENATAIFDNFEQDELYSHLNIFIENKEQIGIQYAGTEFLFPSNILIPWQKKYDVYKDQVDPLKFLIGPAKLNFRSKRLTHPISLLFVINTTCYTDCCYCYADKKTKMRSSIPFATFHEIIAEAKQIGVEGIDISGGEFFLYDDWELLLSDLINNGFSPYISTKVPLKKDQISKLKNTGLGGIQVSLDAAMPHILCDTLKTKTNYLSEMEEMLRTLESFELKVAIHCIMTRATANRENLGQLFSFIEKFNNIKNARIDAAAKSLYLTQEEFEAYRINARDINIIKDCIENKQTTSMITYTCPIETNSQLISGTTPQKHAQFESRGKCSGNTEALIILPNGDVTVCEELYWNKRFIIGNVKRQTLTEIWNSKEALGLYHIKKDCINEASVCKTCESFDECRYGAGVCWRDIINAYGDENWSFPDPKCPQAPVCINDMIYGQ